MIKEDNTWEFKHVKCDEYGNSQGKLLELNGEVYHISDNFASLCHSVLLLVDAINDKKVK